MTATRAWTLFQLVVLALIGHALGDAYGNERPLWTMTFAAIGAIMLAMMTGDLRPRDQDEDDYDRVPDRTGHHPPRR